MRRWRTCAGIRDIGHELLQQVDFLREASDIPYSHHERWDGGGYPRGLRGEEIPLAARIFSVVDVWDALITVRVYKPAWPEAGGAGLSARASPAASSIQTWWTLFLDNYDELKALGHAPRRDPYAELRRR